MFTIVKNIVSLLGLPQTVNGSASLSADAALTAAIRSEVDGAAVLSATLTLEVSTTIIQAASSLVAGDSELTAEFNLLLPAASTLDFQSNLESNVHIVHITTSRPLSGESVLTATMFQPLNVLVLPTVEYQYSDNRLMKFYGIDSGQSLIITGTTGRIVEFQTGTEIEAADYYFGGGRRHVLDDTEVTAVTNAGFGNLITIEGVPSGV